ncbi:hypothetical protein ACH5RR_015116 [Cinchona calisaya]|uniref:Uncharacterized protein n=1 Tax=Cinchona calisaya TaxID=153742 RepID=A0ABD2ZS76_9GENT
MDHGGRRGSGLRQGEGNGQGWARKAVGGVSWGLWKGKDDVGHNRRRRRIGGVGRGMTIGAARGREERKGREGYAIEAGTGKGELADWMKREKRVGVGEWERIAGKRIGGEGGAVSGMGSRRWLTAS